MIASTEQPFFIVFDTSTQPQYYGDVHEILSRPQDSVIRYEYKRYLWQPEAADKMNEFCKGMPQDEVRALLLYGEKKSFKKGDPDPDSMLSSKDSVFLPMRSARIVNVAITDGPTKDQDKIHFHLALDGFLSPDHPKLNALIETLEAQNALPFGDREKQHSWIALLPTALEAEREAFVSHDQRLWSSVVEWFITVGTQFAKDVFWRVTAVEDVTKRSSQSVPRKGRQTNEAGHENRWHRDYLLMEHHRYEISIETHSPGAHGRSVPGNATVRLTAGDDDYELLRVPARPMKLVPNQSEATRFSVASDNHIGVRYVTLDVETQVPDHGSAYPPGSLAELTFAIAKEPRRFWLGIALSVISAALIPAGFVVRSNIYAAVPIAIAVLFSAAGAYYAFTNRLRLGK